jgi:hypothetical protein
LAERLPSEDPDVFYGKLTTWSADDPDTTTEAEVWGTATDVAATVLEAIENPLVGGFCIGMARGVPDDVVLQPRTGDPRDD